MSDIDRQIDRERPETEKLGLIDRKGREEREKEEEGKETKWYILG